jgi:hypothetical protein
MAEFTEMSRKAIIRGGIAGGLIAGAAMLGFAQFYAWFSGAGQQTPLRLISASMTDLPGLIAAGQASGAASTLAVLINGAIIHSVFAAAWGVVFVAAFRELNGPAAFGVGLVFGVAVWAVMTWGVLSWVDMPMYERIRLSPWAFFADHLFYGAFVATGIGFARRWQGKIPAAKLGLNLH